MEFLRSIFAGIMINIAATIYLSAPNKIIGSLLFSFGLLVILVMNYNLYTGKAGYFPAYHIGDLAYILFGNIIGCAIYSTIYTQTKYSKEIQKVAYNLCENKFSASYLDLFIMAILCGIVIFIAVDTYRKNQNIIGITIVILSVIGFILAGFEHSIADISFISLSNYYENFTTVIKVFLIVIGNFIGSLITRLSIEKYKK